MSKKSTSPAVLFLTDNWRYWDILKVLAALFVFFLNTVYIMIRSPVVIPLK